jgi:hypothetical protein
MCSLNTGKMTKKVANRADFDTRITNIGFSEIENELDLDSRIEIM